MTFEELNISKPILKALKEKEYCVPTEIQQRAIPVAFSGSDLLGTAQTGTGKTAAFAIPIIQNLAQMRAEEQKQLDENIKNAPAPEQITTEEDEKKSEGKSHRRGRTGGKVEAKREIRALILTPTRELAAQISDCFTDYSKYVGIKHCVVYGGVKQRTQTDKLKRGVDILIATPGRLLDLMGQGFIKLNSVRYLVLDEADRMLDMGFIDDIRRLLPKLPKERQTFFFSATMPPAIVSLSRSMLHNPVRIDISPEAPIVETIEQMMYFVEKKYKRDLLVDLLKKNKGKSTLVFARTKHGADRIDEILRKSGVQCDAIHGDKTQGARQRALADFKSGKIQVMIATDIAARGIDISDLPIVINYDMPDLAETYVHRIGRTGRAGHSGLAISFCTEEEHELYREIKEISGKMINAELYPQ